MNPRRVIPLHQNESYWLVDETTRTLFTPTSTTPYSTYPDYGELHRAVADYAHVSEENILLTAGSDAAIRALADEYRRAKKHVLLPVPTFYGYERIFAQADLAFEAVVYTELEGRFVFPLAETLAHIQKGVDALFLCSPNNPLGSAIPPEVLTEILDACAAKETMVVVDEAYFEFANFTVLERLGKQPLCILRTFSKCFGLAGARVGYAIASPEMIRTLSVRQLPWSISHLSVHAALAALASAETLLKRLDLIHDERRALVAELSRIPHVQVFESCTNFVLIRVPQAHQVKETLDTMGIRVAEGETMSQVEGARILLKDTLRLAVPSPEDRAYVIDSLHTTLSRV